MAILREWRAEIRRSEKQAYVDYVRSTGFDDYQKTPGNLFALIVTRDIDMNRSEVVTLSGWDTWDAVRKFAGPNPERARYYPTDDQYLLTRPDSVAHYEIHGIQIEALAKPGESGRIGELG
jgi:hypothetical protein